MCFCYSQIALVALCAVIQLTARYAQHHLGHPRDGGWKLPWLSDERRLRLLRWIRDLRPRQATLSHLGQLYAYRMATSDMHEYIPDHTACLRPRRVALLHLGQLSDIEEQVMTL